MLLIHGLQFCAEYFQLLCVFFPLNRIEMVQDQLFQADNGFFEVAARHGGCPQRMDAKMRHGVGH